jgi:hypothetical protein
VGEIKEKMKGVNPIKIYCMHLYKWHYVTPINYNMLIFKNEKKKVNPDYKLNSSKYKIRLGGAVQ